MTEKADLPSLKYLLQQYKDRIVLHDDLDEFTEKEFADRCVSWPIAWLLKSIHSARIQRDGIPKFTTNDQFNTLIDKFVRVRNSPRQLERFFYRLWWNFNPAELRIVDRVQDALDYALTRQATTPPATIFGQPAAHFRYMYDRSHDTEALFEHCVMAPMFLPLFTLFQPECNRPSVTSKLQPDWAFLTDHQDGFRWFCSETKIDASDTKDATAILVHLQDAVQAIWLTRSYQRTDSVPMRPEFAIGLRTFLDHGVTNMELSLLTFKDTTTPKSKLRKWHYYVFPTIRMKASSRSSYPDLDPARRLIATLVLVGTLVHLNCTWLFCTDDAGAEDEDEDDDGDGDGDGDGDDGGGGGGGGGGGNGSGGGKGEPTARHLPPTLVWGHGTGDSDRQPPQDDAIEHLDVSEQAALSSFVLLPERPLPRADIHIVSRSSKTVVYCLEEPAACHVASQSSDAPQLSSTSAQAPRPLDLAPNRAPMPRAIKVTKKLAEAAVEVAALHRLRGLKRVPPLLECFRLASSDDPFAEPQHQAHQRSKPAVAQSRVAIVTPFIRSPRSVREFRDNEPAFKRIVRRLLRVLHECHVRRVVHGDVRVANILVDSAKIDVTLIDFGFATIDSRKSLIGNRNSSAEDVRQVALVTLAVMCGITYGSQDYSHLLKVEWSRFDFGMLLQSDNRASSSLAKWQLELVYLAIEWGRNCTKLSCSTMHEQLLAISQPQSLVSQPQVKPATAMARSIEEDEREEEAQG